MLALDHHVDRHRATVLVFNAERRIWRHNLPKSRSWRIRCAFDDVRGRRGVPTDCTFRAYRTRDFKRRMLVLPILVSVVRPHRTLLFEDGSGWIRFDSKRALYLNPRAPH